MKMRPPWLCTLGSLGLIACGPASPSNTPEASPPGHDRAEIAQALRAHRTPCAPPPRVAVEDRAAIFVEAAVFEVPSALAASIDAASVRRLEREPGVRLLGTPHVSCDLNRRSTLTIERRTGPVVQSFLHQLSCSATLAEPDLAVLELELVVQPATGPRELSAERTSGVTLNLAARDRQPLLQSAVLGHDPSRSLVAVVTSYRVRSDADLRAVFDCKMQRAARDRSRSREP